MYNKLFTKILDSSIWLEPNPTRIVWITFIAAMDQDGFAQFSSIRNLANRAMVTVEDAEAAVKTLESPDPDSHSQKYEGRRIERVPGGWIILNSEEHREMVTRAVVREQTRERVARHREKMRNASVTPSEADPTPNPEANNPEKKNTDMARKRASTRKAPEDFTITDSLREWAWKNCPGVDLDLETEAFKDYTFASGKTDWPATWRSWMRKANKGKRPVQARYDALMAQVNSAPLPDLTNNLLLTGKTQ
jgi:hypothetical protein